MIGKGEGLENAYRDISFLPMRPSARIAALRPVESHVMIYRKYPSVVQGLMMECRCIQRASRLSGDQRWVVCSNYHQ